MGALRTSQNGPTSVMNVRVRFAPSPTGHLHIGGLRSALFNWLFAKHHKGVFLLRIEDTDVERSKQEYTAAIMDAFAWVGILPDEPVVIQSARLAQHQEIIEQLLLHKKAYRCYCSSEQVIERRAQKVPAADAQFVLYDGYCKQFMDAPQNKPFAIRFITPGKGTLQFDDLIRGTITFDLALFDDFVIARSDGTPMYNFVVVIDDHFMRISHVIRAEEHISNTPKQILLYKALEYPIAQFAHLPLILGADGSKLSKRDAATAVIDYKTAGYLPDALINYLVRLGWAHGDQEIFTKEEMIAHFSLEAVSKKGAIFNQEKLDWTNSVYMRAASDDQLLRIIKDDVDADFMQKVSRWNQPQILQLIALYKQRVNTLKQLAHDIMRFAQGPSSYDEADVAQWLQPETAAHLQQIADIIAQQPHMDIKQLQAACKAWCVKQGIAMVNIAQPLRIALTGKASGPGVFELLALLDQKEITERIARCVQVIAQKTAQR